MSSTVSVKNLSFGYPNEDIFLEIPAFSLEQGEKVFLKGRSGSGKSTFISLLSGILTPQKGEIYLKGSLLSSLSQSEMDILRGKHIGFIFQQFNLIPYLSVEENITAPQIFSPSKKQKIGGKEREICNTLLKELALNVDPKKRADALSVGQQQRVAVARSLFGSPDLIIADEPTSALDPQSSEEFIKLLFKECDKYNATLIFISHDPKWESLFPRVVDMSELNQKGKIL